MCFGILNILGSWLLAVFHECEQFWQEFGFNCKICIIVHYINVIIIGKGVREAIYVVFSP